MENNNRWFKYLQIGLQMLVTIGLGVWLGIKTDSWLKWRFPVFTILFSLLFIFVSIYNVIRQFPDQK